MKKTQSYTPRPQVEYLYCFIVSINKVCHIILVSLCCLYQGSRYSLAYQFVLVSDHTVSVLNSLDDETQVGTLLCQYLF